MATVTKGRTFVSGETVTPTKLNELVDLATVTAIEATDIASGAVTIAKLGVGAQQALVPTGAVMPFAMNSAPAGWLAADGTAVGRSAYATLFTAIGTTHGAGDGSTTFNLPDLRGYFIRGVGTNSDGVAAGTFATKQAAAFASHTHTGTAANAGNHVHTVGAPVGNVGAGGALRTADGAANENPSSRIGINAAGEHSHTITINATGGTETRPANIALLYCIKF